MSSRLAEQLPEAETISNVAHSVTFLTVPADIRLCIYDLVFADEQDSITFDNTLHSLKIVRSPALSRINIPLRIEYFVHYFNNATFSINANIDHGAIINNFFDPALGAANMPPAQVIRPTDEIASIWFKALSSRDRAAIRFRHIVYCPTDRYGNILGFWLHVWHYGNAYHVEMHIMPWVTVEEMLAKGGRRALFAPLDIVDKLRQLCSESTGEVMSVKLVLELEQEFGRRDVGKYTTALSPGDDVVAKDWLPEKWVDKMRAGNKCFSEVLPLKDKGRQKKEIVVESAGAAASPEKESKCAQPNNAPEASHLVGVGENNEASEIHRSEEIIRSDETVGIGGDLDDIEGDEADLESITSSLHM